MLTFITLPSNFIASIVSDFQEVFGDLAPLVALIIGLPIAFWFLEILITRFARIWEIYTKWKD
jgi:hypothetical protein